MSPEASGRKLNGQNNEPVTHDHLRKVGGMTKRVRGKVIVGVVCVAWVLSSLLGGMALANGSYLIQFFTEPIPTPLCEPGGTELKLDFSQSYWQAKVKVLGSPIKEGPKTKIKVLVEEVLNGHVPGDIFFLYYARGDALMSHGGAIGLPDEALGKSYYVLGRMFQGNITTYSLSKEQWLNTLGGSCVPKSEGGWEWLSDWFEDEK